MEVQDLDTEDEESLAQIQLAEEGFSSDGLDDAPKSWARTPIAALVITPDEIKKLWLMKGFDKQLMTLATIIKRPLYQSCVLDGVFVDFTFYNIHFCKEAGFCGFKAANIVAMMNTVFDHAMKSEFLEINETYEVLKTDLTQQILSFNESNERHKQFTSVEVTRLTDYITTSFFRYFRLYRYVFMNKRVSRTEKVTVVVEEPHGAAPLSQGRQDTPGTCLYKPKLKGRFAKRKEKIVPVSPEPVEDGDEDRESIGTSDSDRED